MEKTKGARGVIVEQIWCFETVGRVEREREELYDLIGRTDIQRGVDTPIICSSFQSTKGEGDKHESFTLVKYGKAGLTVVSLEKLPHKVWVFLLNHRDHCRLTLWHPFQSFFLAMSRALRWATFVDPDGCIWIQEDTFLKFHQELGLKHGYGFHFWLQVYVDLPATESPTDVTKRLKLMEAHRDLTNI